MDTNPSSTPLKVFVVEDAAPVRRNLARLLGAIAGVEMAGEAEDGQSALVSLLARAADVAVVDLRLAGSSGIELISALSKQRPEIVTIAFTNHSGSAFRTACKAAGAHFFFDKTAEFDAACRTIAQLAATRAQRAAR
ncbi:MAG TPA: response regulator transcription factor [Paraburkholderia sp.]|jgi:DNA-binding NarL/FixJ family response regulator|nr:response regulator transcription factor [Paraburkholderia sp.]